MHPAANMAAQLMAAAARTAPKAGGKDLLEIVVIDNPEDLKRVAARMAEYAPRSTNEAFWNRDAANCAQAEAVLLVGLSKFSAAGYDCGTCGFPTCKEFVQSRQARSKELGYTGPHCAMRLMDVGCALASAAKSASILSVDNRVQQRVGAAARDLGYIEAEVVMGIPLGIYGKSPFHDRATPPKH